MLVQHSLSLGCDVQRATFHLFQVHTEHVCPDAAAPQTAVFADDDIPEETCVQTIREPFGQILIRFLRCHIEHIRTESRSSNQCIILLRIAYHAVQRQVMFRLLLLSHHEMLHVVRAQVIQSQAPARHQPVLIVLILHHVQEHRSRQVPVVLQHIHESRTVEQLQCSHTRHPCQPLRIEVSSVERTRLQPVLSGIQSCILTPAHQGQGQQTDDMDNTYCSHKRRFIDVAK